MKKFSSFITKTLILSFFLLTAVPAVSGLSDAHASAGTIYSADNNTLADTMCNAMKIVTGSAGKAFAAFAIISLGIGFFTGKISWGLMIGVSMGIAAMFGAPTIVSALSGKEAVECS